MGQDDLLVSIIFYKSYYFMSRATLRITQFREYFRQLESPIIYGTEKNKSFHFFGESNISGRKFGDIRSKKLKTLDRMSMYAKSRKVRLPQTQNSRIHSTRFLVKKKNKKALKQFCLFFSRCFCF